MLNKEVIRIGSVIWQRDTGKHVDAIRLEETIDHALRARIPSVTLLAYNKLGEYIWHDTFDTEQTAAGSQLERLRPEVEHLLKEAGWEVHILDPLKKEKAADYIHAACYGLQVHEVPFSAETNTELRLEELCEETGTIRSKEETLALLKERIGVETFELEYETEDTRNHVLAVLEAEGLDLEDLHDVDGQELTTGAQGFRWFRDNDEAEDEARVHLTDDDDIWKEAVAAGNTTDGLEEWAEDVIRIDGWAQTIGSYDGLERIAQLKDGTWFQYVRSD